MLMHFFLVFFATFLSSGAALRMTHITSDPPEPRYDECKASTQQATASALHEATPVPRIAWILRGESFRTPNAKQVKNDEQWKGKQFGPKKRSTCGEGAFESQQEVAQRQLEGFAFLESMGYAVDLFGATYPCDEATKLGDLDYNITKFYDGRLRDFKFLYKKNSTQITPIQQGFHLVTTYMSQMGVSYDHVIMGRFDAAYAIHNWACHLKDMHWPQDLFTLEGIDNDDNLLVVPQRHIQCFGAFLNQDDKGNSNKNEDTHLTCCHGHCGGGDCHPCVRNFAQAVYGETLPRKKLPTCKVAPNFKRLLPIYTDIPDWLPDSDRECAEERNRNHDEHP